MSFIARVSYTANGSTDTFSFSFPYILSSHVKAFVNGTEDNGITFPTSSTVQLSSTPANGAVVLIKRATPSDARLVDFQDGSVLTSADLDQSADQNFYIAQETTDNVASKLGLDASGNYDAGSNRIINVANPVDTQDAVTKNYLENTWLSTSDKANLTTVAGISSDVTDVANNNTDVSTVAGEISPTNNISTVAAADTNIGLVGGSIANVNTVASNITGVNSFAERYRVGSADPTTSLDEGDLAYNSTANALKYYDGTSWTSIAPGIANVSDDSSPQLGGNLDTQSFTVDGRDVSVDGAKLDTIATSATANPNAIDNVVEDTTPQLGGALDGQNNNLNNIGTVDGTNLQLDFGSI